MKRYLLFAGSHYYPSGGFNDFIGSFDTIEECQLEKNVTETHGDKSFSLYDWAHVVDGENEFKQISWMSAGYFCRNKRTAMWSDIEHERTRYKYFVAKERELQGLPPL